MSNSEDKKDVEIFNRINRLKVKAGGDPDGGPGTIEQSKIESANSVVINMADLYPEEIKNVLEALNSEWDELKSSSEGDDRSALVEKISNTANQVKDLGSTFGYDLMAHFGGSLRDYIMDTELSQEEHFTIVQAHIDVMAVTYRENIKDDDGGPLAEELKKNVEVAIEKYSKSSKE